MIRSGSPADRLRPKVRTAATILFAGPMASGVGIAADIAADVARLSHRTVVRRRDFTQAASPVVVDGSHAVPQSIVLQLVSFGDAVHPADPKRVDIAIAWNAASAAALKAAGIEAGETIIVDHDSFAAEGVPTWRRDLLTDGAGSSSHHTEPSQARGLQQTARALKALSRRTPFTRELWERVLKLHVPARRRRATTGEFTS